MRTTADGAKVDQLMRWCDAIETGSPPPIFSAHLPPNPHRLIMKTIYEKLGFKKQEWDTYKAEAREIMIETARGRAMIPYSDLANQMTTISLEAFDLRLWEIIGDVARDEANAGRGILSVVVVHKSGDMEPGNGFFELAKYYKRNLSNRQKCFLDELHKVHDQWAN